MKSHELVVYYGMRLKKFNGEYYCNGAFGRYIDELAKKYENLYLVMPTMIVEDFGEVNDYKLRSSNIVVQEIPGYTGYLSALKKYKEIKKSIQEYSKEWDSPIYVRWPVPFFKYVYRIANRKCLPVCFHLVGDSRAVISEGSKYKGLKKVLAKLFADFNSYLIQKVIKNTPTLVNGNGLRRLYNKHNDLVKEIRTSTFNESEVETSLVPFNNNQVKLLYVGYLRHEKGLSYLLDAVNDLTQKNINVCLTIVGEGDIIEELKHQTKVLDIEQIVIFKGYIPLGDSLFNEYIKHNIFILPSISEGTPRVLLEAMSKGLAVVATNVGGIPFTIKDGENGLLVSPKDSNQLSKAIFRLINNKELREGIILNGLQFAKENTIESHVNEVYDFIKDKCTII